MYYEAICPHCGLVLINQNQNNQPIVKLENQQLAFCSEECRDNYLKDPEKFFGETACGCGSGCGCH